MNKLTSVVFTLLILYMHASCSSNPENPIINGKLNIQVQKVILDYIKRNPDYNTFFLSEAPRETMGGKAMSGFLLGPDYDNLAPLTERTVYVEIEGRRIYLCSNLFSLFANTPPNEWKNLHPADSLNIEGLDFPITDPGYNFLYRAVFFFYEEDEIRVINRPDSLFMPLTKNHLRFEY